LVTLALLLATLAAGIWGVWSLAIRPALHARADNAIRSELQLALAPVPTLPPLAVQLGLTHISASQDFVNSVLQKQLASSGQPVSAQLAFQSGQVVIQYTALSMPGTISTTLTAQGGRLVTTNTQVSGALGLVETGDELQATLNQALAELQTKVPYGFSSVQSEGGTLTLRLNTGSG
jgi:hypothetical protein